MYMYLFAANMSDSNHVNDVKFCFIIQVHNRVARKLRCVSTGSSALQTYRARASTSCFNLNKPDY